ncbi:hypothetical protein [Frigoriglobus tundricola]|uniref:Uncharacterized protein n=1 Tax=Frigoriglobus tundricola TaxID=2774151 RepID=A0A6M5Z1U5_9BACT|nr:hypothetical protein [Frigoriglobus tundricola]QJX00149.1 hypothetical protein FTUN_7773 [Frigoriglobus tundricola]
MARDRKPPPSNSDPNWDRTVRMFQAGAPEFVDAVRLRVNGAVLAPFAETWYTDPRVEAKRLLFAYLERPFNSPRHEPLVKRIFKFAEAAGDDAVMARFLVGFDRTIRRHRVTKQKYNSRRRQYEQYETVATRTDTTLSREDRAYTGPWFAQNREQFVAGKFLFSVATRNYLRRRAWRYFRRLGRAAPDRYVPAVCTALKLYTDADVPDGVALLDNWGLVHVLFHHSPTLEARASGWRVATGGSLSRLQPDPMFRKLWLRGAEPIFDLLVNARCATVARWAMMMLRRNFPDRLARVELSELLMWIGSPNPVLNELALDLLETRGGLESMSIEDWLTVAESARPELLDRICVVVARVVKPEAVNFANAVRLAMQRPVPLARLGFLFLQGKKPVTHPERVAVFGLRNAAADPVRVDLVKWACGVLSEQPDFDPLWVLEFLDSRFNDVREVGWEWLQSDARARDSVLVWQRLLESPYDDIRLRLVGMLEDRAKEPAGLSKYSPESVRLLWASVLLNVHRGSRAKPFVVRQIIDRLSAHPDEAGELLPMVAVALRSVRGPEFRAGLAGITNYVTKYPTRKPLVEAVFPELKWE